MLVQTHAPGSGKCAVAAHPFNEKEVSSCGPDAVLRVWDLDTRCARMTFALADAAPGLAAPPAGIAHQGSSSSALGTPTFEAHSMAYSSASASGDFHLAVGCKGTPYTLHPAPYTLHPTPYTLHPTPYTLHPTP